MVYEKAVNNDLKHFDVEMDKLQDVVTFVTGLIKVRAFATDYGVVLFELEDTGAKSCPTCKTTDEGRALMLKCLLSF